MSIVGTTPWVVFLAVATVFAGTAVGQKSSLSIPQVPVLTVCEALGNLAFHKGTAVILVGKVVSTTEGRWLIEDCAKKLTTSGYSWPNAISLSYLRRMVKPPPAMPVEFKWETALLETKLQQVQKTTKLEISRRYRDKWFAIFGRLDAVVPPKGGLGADHIPRGLGFGHLGMAPAQLISDKDGQHELGLAKKGEHSPDQLPINHIPPEVPTRSSEIPNALTNNTPRAGSTPSSGLPEFSQFPAILPATGAIAIPKLRGKSNQIYRDAIEAGMKRGPNFAAHYALVSFRIGNGPLGAAVVDTDSGSVFHLPRQIAREDLFIYDTDCLEPFKRWRTYRPRKTMMRHRCRSSCRVNY
jgi:hypothetical protein